MQRLHVLHGKLCSNTFLGDKYTAVQRAWRIITSDIAAGTPASSSDAIAISECKQRGAIPFLAVEIGSDPGQHINTILHNPMFAF